MQSETAGLRMLLMPLVVDLASPLPLPLPFWAAPLETKGTVEVMGSSEGADSRHQGEVFDDLVGRLLGQMQQGLGRLIDAEHGTTIEIALYGFRIPQG